MDRDLRRKIQACVESHGREAVLTSLLSQGISLSTAQKLVCDGYHYKPKMLLLRAIVAAMEESGG